MNSPTDLHASRPVEHVTLERLLARSPLVRDLCERIGGAYAWPSLKWTDAQWDEWLADPDRQQWGVTYGDEIAGLAEIEIRGGEVEIATFGLVPEFVGKGIGGYALTLTVQQSWRSAGAARVWLHTSSQDHPHALENYRRRGFHDVRSKEY